MKVVVLPFIIMFTHPLNDIHLVYESLIDFVQTSLNEVLPEFLSFHYPPFFHLETKKGKCK